MVGLRDLATVTIIVSGLIRLYLMEGGLISVETLKVCGPLTLITLALHDGDVLAVEWAVLARYSL